MPNKTSFRIEWLKKKDSNGQLLERWCEKRSQYEVFCHVCKKNIRCDNQGLSQLIKHSATQTHVSLVKGIINGTQTILVKQPTESTYTQETSLSCFSAKEEVIKAELLWALKVASSNFSYNSSNDLSDLFRGMFPDSIIASKFSISPSKLSYLITEATGPHFHEVLLFDVRNSASPYTIEYDELTNKEIKKQLDLKIRYWSKSKNKVRVHHLDTFLMGQAKSHDIVVKIMQSINDAKLLLRDLISLSSDGPNVNKAVFQKISEIKKSQNLPALLNVGFCNLHMVHNVFRKAVNEFGDEIVDFIVDLHYFFKQSPVRVEELKDLQDELGFKNLKLLKHVESRWLTLGPALDRLASQWPVVSEYFLKRLPKRDLKISENARYLRIVMCLKRPNTTLVKVHFLLSLANTLQPFLALFQREEPLIHLVYERMDSLVRKLYGRFLKIMKFKKMSLQELQLLKFPAIDFELGDDELEIGVQSRKYLAKVKETLQKELKISMRRCLKNLAQGLLEKTLSLNIVVKEARCLKPENISKSWSLKAVKNLASNVDLSPPLNVDLIGDEWRVLQCESIPKDWYTYEIDDEVSPRRIDDFFNNIFSLRNDLGQEKYPELARLVKVILLLPHGNADVERGFSQTSNFLTDSRTCLNQASISALQTTKDGLKVYNNKCHLVPIPREFLKKGATAYKSYMERIEEDKRIAAELKQQNEKEREQKEEDKKELERKKADMEKKTQTAKEAIRKERSLEKAETEATIEMDTYKTLVDEANERIRNALKNQDLKGVKIGQTMLEGACKKVQEGISHLNQIRNEQKEIEKTKRTMLDFFCSSQSKKQKK